MEIQGTLGTKIMAYTAIADSEFEEGKPARGITMVTLRDNTLEIALGSDASAPKVQSAAIQDAAIVTAKLADDAVTTAKIDNNQVTYAKLNSGLKAYKGVGTYLLANPGANFSSPGGTIAGSTIGASGTWRNMSNSTSTNTITLFFRIA